MKADFYAKLPFGTLVRVEGGKLATVVYHGLDGYGIRWGDIRTALSKIATGEEVLENFPAEAMLREVHGGADLPCIGEDYELEIEEKP